MRLDGILAPVVTPFDARGELDADGFAANVRAHLAAGLLGVVVAGSTGEAALLDDAERGRLLDLARAELPVGRPLIAGIGAESTRATVARARAAAERGADAVLVVAPHYYGEAMTAAALGDHYRRVADESPRPVLLYTIPKYMHFALSPDLVSTLAQHGNIAGMKDSSGDAVLFGQYLGARSDGFWVLTGSGSLLGEALTMGADGAILAVALFAPRPSLAVWEAARAGDHPRLAAAQAVLTPLASRIVGAFGVAGVKAALDAAGLVGGAPRAPLRALDGDRQAEVRALLDAAELAPTV